MTAYIFGAGASAHAGYPLSSELLQKLSDWLDRLQASEQSGDFGVLVGEWRNRIVQVREHFGSLDDFEGILGRLDAYGGRRVSPSSPTTYRQNYCDIFHDCAERAFGGDLSPRDPQGFYPQYLRSDLICALREFFYWIETNRSGSTAYYGLATQRVKDESFFLTLNYDVALEAALVRAGKWDVGVGYGFPFPFGRNRSSVTVYKLHGSVNWFQAPMQQNPPPIMFPRDLNVLGYEDVADPRVGGTAGIGVNGPGTLILPDPNKMFSWTEFWTPLWTDAARRLREASEVFISGYRMPEADEKARQLLFDNIKRDASICVYCLDESDRIAGEFRRRGFTKVEPFPAIRFEVWAEQE